MEEGEWEMFFLLFLLCFRKRVHDEWREVVVMS